MSSIWTPASPVSGFAFFRSFSRNGSARFIEADDGLVDGAVVAPVVHHDLRAVREGTRPADDEAVGVGGGQRELPVRKPEAPRHFPADPGGILGGQHQGDASGRLRGDRIHGDPLSLKEHK